MPRKLYPVKLVEKLQLAHNTVLLSLSFDKDKDFQFIAGQFIQLMFSDDDQQYKRSYSIANSPQHFSKLGLLEIVVSFVEGGIASKLFNNITAGYSMDLAGPFGILTLPESIDGHIILIGTGTGIAPYHSMLPALENLINTIPITLITGARYRDDRIYHETFKNLNSKYKNFCYYTYLSREKEINIDENEYIGYVQDHLSHIHINPKTDLVYLCGNPSMVDDTATLLKNKGLSSKQIKREKYVYSGH